MATPNHPLMPRHLRLHDLFPENAGAGVDVVTGRRLVLGNAQVRPSYAVAREPSPLYRNAIGDECVFVEAGAALVQTVSASSPPGRVTTCSFPARPCTAGCRSPSRARCGSTRSRGNSHIGPPKRYLSRFGQLLEHSPYCERDLHGPAEPLRGGRHRSRCRCRGLHQTPRAWPVRHRRVDRGQPAPPVRCGRLGRLPVPVHVQRRRFRADHRAGASAAAGASSLRGHQFRRLQFRSAQGGLPPAGDSGAALPSNADSDEIMFYVAGYYVATTRPARARASDPARSACTPVGTPTARRPVLWRLRWASTI